eukprot:8834509-Pyramimonas_sp.AAC.1
MIRTLPEGHFELNNVDIQGTELEEVHDDGSAIIAQGQLESKYAALSKTATERAVTAASYNSAAESHALVTEAEEVRGCSEAEGGSSSESEEQDDLSFIRSSGMRAILARDEDVQRPSAVVSR